MKIALSLAAALSALTLAAGAPAFEAAAQTQPAAASTVLEGAERTRALAQASAALNRLTAAQGRFVQAAPDGSLSEGDISIQRPGKLRFAYDAPSPYTIVSDGTTVSVEDRALKDVSRVPLRSTPLYYVLKRDVNLERDARVTQVAKMGDQTRVTARDRSGEADGEITITFVGPNYELRQWSITDGQNQTTRVTLSNIRAVEKLSPRLFQVGTDDAATRRNR